MKLQFWIALAGLVVVVVAVSWWGLRSFAPPQLHIKNISSQTARNLSVVYQRSRLNLPNIEPQESFDIPLSTAEEGSIWLKMGDQRSLLVGYITRGMTGDVYVHIDPTRVNANPILVLQEDLSIAPSYK